MRTALGGVARHVARGYFRTKSAMRTLGKAANHTKIARKSFVLLCVLGAFVVVLLCQAPFAWRRFYVYPRTEAALAALGRQRAPAEPLADGLIDLRGIIHCHSDLSHDSMGTPGEIIAAGQRAGIDYLIMTDHFGWLTDADVIRRGLRGEHGGILFIVGAEMRDGVMPLFLDRPPDRYDPHEPLQGYVNDLRALGAVVFLDHPDDPRRRWDIQGWTGMEIYNLHADARKTNLALYSRLSEQFWSMDRYPLRVYYRIFREPHEYLALWDRFTTRRRVVGIAGNDAHQNNGARLVVRADGALLLTDTSGNPHKAPWLVLADPLSRHLARWRFGDLTPGRTLWRADADLYERTFRFVSTHLLASSRTESALRRALEEGHAYVAFDSLAAATGFDFALRQAGARRAIMGDEVAFGPQEVLEVRVPVEAVLRLVHGGHVIRRQTGRRLLFPVHSPGVYRIEAHLQVRGQLLPWIYSNPIYVR